MDRPDPRETKSICERERAGQELLALQPPPGEGPEPDWEDQKREILNASTGSNGDSVPDRHDIELAKLHARGATTCPEALHPAARARRRTDVSAPDRSDQGSGTSRRRDGEPATALAFRNVDASPDDPVPEWPLEAIQTALDRGNLPNWRCLAAVIREEPWGPVARSVEEVLTYSRPYGVAEAMERIVARAREAAERGERDAVAGEVAALVRASGLTRAEFASRIGTSASRLSTYTTGKVTPSSSLLVRMCSVAERQNPEGFASLAGAWRGRVKIADDFDELPDDIAESLGMRP